MKLFYITNARLPNDKGHGIQVVKMAGAFKKMLGSNFGLIIPNKAQPEGFNNTIKDFYSLRDELPVNKLNIPDPMVLSRYLPDFFEKILFPLGIIIYGFAVFRFCLNNRSSVFYTRDFYLLPFIFLTGAEVYYEAHYFPANKLGAFLHKILVPKLAGLIVLTKSFQTYFDKEGFKYKKILISPDAVDTDFFQNVSKDGVDKLREKYANKNELIIGYIGRLQGLGEDKGGGLLLNAFSKVNKEFPKTKLLIVGEKSGETRTNIVFTGNLPYKDMPKYFALIDIAVIPYPDRPHFRYFMSPLKLFDYLAVGKPIVTSDLPSIREILTEDNAVFFAPDDPDSLANAIADLLKDPNKTRQMAEKNKILAAKYTWDLRVRGIINFCSLS